MTPYDTSLLDPRPLAPPDPPLDPDPEPYWHLLSADAELEHYAYSPEEVAALLPAYCAHGSFTVRSSTYIPED